MIAARRSTTRPRGVLALFLVALGVFPMPRVPASFQLAFRVGGRKLASVPRRSRARFGSCFSSAGAGRKVPALALSAYVREEDRIRARSAGFQRHLAKPFEPADLIACWGHAVEVAGSGPGGIEMALQKRPEIVLIDIGLPGLDGYQVAGRIREALVATR